MNTICHKKYFFFLSHFLSYKRLASSSPLSFKKFVIALLLLLFILMELLGLPFIPFILNVTQVLMLNRGIVTVSSVISGTRSSV